MSAIKYLRQKLGPIKCAVVDEWPYLKRMKEIPKVRAKYRPLLEKLPPLPPFVENQCELHMLCGHRDVDMGVWASWSIMRFMDGRARLYVHSDGSLTEEDEKFWKGIIGEVVFISRQDSDRKVEQALASKTTHLYPWRCTNWASAQLVDVHFYGEAPNLLILDSDVLTFQPPTELIEALGKSAREFRWCLDLRDAYSATPEVLQEVTGIRMPPQLCAGFLVSPRLGIEDFLALDEQMKRIDADPRVSVGHFWSCQTYYGIVAGGLPGSRPLPDTYSNSAGKTTDRQVLRHYVGIPRVRFRYYSEGLARILKSLGMTPGS